MRKLFSFSPAPLEAGRLRPLVLIGVVLALLAGVAPANAQIFAGQYGPADQLLQSNLDTVDRWMWYGNMYGYTRGGNFYGMYGRDGRRLSRPVRIVMGTASAATIGGGLAGKKGALIGGGAYLLTEVIVDAVRNRNRQDEVVVQLPDQVSPMPQTTSGRENGWNERLRQQANASGTYQRGQRGGRPVNNRTGLDVLLWVGNSEVAIEISRGGHAQVPRNPGGMKAETIETAPGGREVRRPALVVPNHELDGWDIIVPAGR